MSWTDEEIDNLFQESAKAQTFEYNNAYFSEVEAMLPVNKKGKDFLWMGTALLFIAVLTTAYFVNNNNENTLNGSNDQLANLELNNQKETTSNSTAKVEEKQMNNAITGEALFNNESTDTDSASNGAEDGGLNKSYYTPQQQQGWSKSMYNWNPKENQDQAALSVKMNGDSGDSDHEIDGQGSEIAPLINLKADTKATNQKEQFVNRAPITAGLGVNSLNQGLDRELIPNALMPVMVDLRPKSAFYLELNTGMSQSFVTPEEYTSSSYGGGIGVESYLGKFNLTTGLNFKWSNHNDLTLSRTAKLYGFGSTETTNILKYKNVSSLELPISLGYSFGKHNVNIGVRASMLIGAKINFQSYDGEELTRSEDVNALAGDLKYFGLTRFGLKPTLGYSYHINKWTIGANVGVQLMQTVNEEYINGFNNRFPVDGQIYLRRTIRLRK